jgi:hypothetical protein
LPNTRARMSAVAAVTLRRSLHSSLTCLRCTPHGLRQRGKHRLALSSSLFDPHRPFRPSQQPPPTVGLRTFGNSYPQSSIGIHPMSLIAAVRPRRGVLFGCHRVSGVSWRGVSVW